MGPAIALATPVFFLMIGLEYALGRASGRSNYRLGHASAVFWASHVVHHQSQEYNLSTALRQTSSGALLGWFDRWFASPSNHRVHHAVNDRYLDRNCGGIFMAWDRLFGTFVEEDERCVYGTRAPLDSWDPLWANLEAYADLARKSRRAPRWRDRLLVWIKPPGWQPAHGGEAWRKPAFDLRAVRRYDPPMSRGTRVFAAVQLAGSVLATMPLLWYSAQLPGTRLGAYSAGIVVVLWLTGAVMQGRLRVGPALAIEAVLAAALAAA
jgi:hypothetical protein